MSNNLTELEQLTLKVAAIVGWSAISGESRMSERKLKVSPLVAPRNHEGRIDKELALERLKKQGYVPRICKEKDE